MKRELTAEEKLRKKQWHQAYYLANREHILAKQKEYYHRKGKAWNAERVRNYRRANHEAYLTKRKEYRDSHKEYFAELNRRYFLVSLIPTHHSLAKFTLILIRLNIFILSSHCTFCLSGSTAIAIILHISVYNI